jgi:hypothetical protein|tara:strand:+ start:4326 stop:4784 length:459 start_codon:yes stop_codon:yes gene_type:complete
MSEQELRYWDRLGFYITRADADEFISKAGNIGAVLDEDLEEFTPRSGVSQDSLRKEVNALFEKPFVEVSLSSENNAILIALEFEKTRPARVKELKKEGFTTEEAKEMFKQELDIIVRNSLGLPDETDMEKEYRERAVAIKEGKPDPAFEEEE